MNNSTDNLVDIKNISINKDLSKNERIAEFVRQIKNPYCFKCGKYTIESRFSDNGITLEDCLKSILL